MRYLILLIFLSSGIIANAQKVETNGKVYKVKGEKIFQSGKDITHLLSETEKAKIKDALKLKTESIKDIKKKEKNKKEIKKKDKKQKKLEKSQKKAEKQIKRSEKA